MDDILLYGLVANSAAPADYVVSEEALSVEPYGIMLRQKDPGLQEDRRRYAVDDLSQRRDHPDLCQMVSEPDSAERRQPQRADERSAEARHRDADR